MLSKPASRYGSASPSEAHQGLANAIDLRRAPAVLVAQWIEQARRIHDARAVSIADREEADAEFGELVARFRIEPPRSLDPMRTSPKLNAKPLPVPAGVCASGRGFSDA